MADRVENISLNFNTNADQVQGQVDSLLGSLDKNTQEYEQMTIAARGLAEAEMNLSNAKDKLANASNHTAGAVASMTNNLEQAEAEYKKQISSVGALTNRIQGSSAASNSHTTAIRSNTQSVLDNGGAVGILDSFTGGLATTTRDAYEASTLLSGGMGKALTAFKAFSTGAKAALIATGIGALVVLVGTLITYWDDIKGVVSGVGSEMKSLGESSKENADVEKNKLDTLSSQDNILKQQGKTEVEILAIKVKQGKTTIKALEAQLIAQEAIRKAQIDAAQRNKDILSGILKFISIPVTALLYAIDEVGKAFGKNFNLSSGFDKIANLLFDPSEVAKEGDKTVNETKKQLLNLKNTVAGYENSINDSNKAAADKKREDANKSAEELGKIEEDRLAKMKEMQTKYAADIANINAKTDQEKLDLDKQRAQAELNAMELSANEKLVLQKQLNEKFKLLQADLNDKNSADLLSYLEKFKAKEKEYADLKTSEEIESLRQANAVKIQAEREASIAMATEKAANNIATTEQLKAIDDYYDVIKLSDQANFIQANLDLKASAADEEAKIEASKNAVISDSKANLVSITSSLEESGLAKTKAGQIVAKGIALTQIGIDSAIAISKASTLANAEGVAAQLAFPTIPGIGTIARVLSYTATGLQVTSNIIRAKQLLSGGSGGSSSGGSSSGGTISASSAPNVSFVASSENQIANGINRNNQEQPPIKAYVVAGEVTTQQQLDRNLVTTTTL